MKVRIQMVFEAEDGKPEVIENVGQLQRGPLRPSELGLSLAEAKSLLHGMQQSMVAEQVEHYLGQFKACEHCSAQRTKKGLHTIVFRTLFGKLNINSPRLSGPPVRFVQNRPHPVILVFAASRRRWSALVWFKVPSLWAPYDTDRSARNLSRTT